VIVPFDVPEGFEADCIRVEVFEPVGEVNIPMII
jgi:hypothetical protein